MSKKDDSFAISLFSFQDIITSLTGIMFLIVLLLVLFLLDMRPKTDESSVSSATDSAEQIQELEKKLEKLKERKVQMQEQVEKVRKMDLEHIHLRISQMREDIQKLLAKAEADKLQIQEIRESVKLEQAALPELRKKTDAILEENRLLDERIQAKEKLLKSNQAQTKFFKQAAAYTVENGSTLKPVLVECSQTGIRILDVSNGDRFDLRKPYGTFYSREKAFVDWIRKRDYLSEYYTIMIKPGSFEYANLISVLKKIHSNIERGLEILPDDSATVFGEN